MKRISVLLVAIFLIIGLALPTLAAGWISRSHVELVDGKVQGYGCTVTSEGTLDYVFISTYLYEDNLIVSTAFNQAYYTTSCYTSLKPVLYMPGKTYKVQSTHTLNDGGIFKTVFSLDTLFL